MLKRFLMIIATVFIFASFSAPVYADDFVDPHAPDRYDPERMAKEEKKYNDAVEYLNNKRQAYTSGQKILTVYQAVQERSYWCGPASAQIVIKYPEVDGRLISQSTLATDMGTDDTGTYVYKLAHEVWAYSHNYDYGYSHMADRHFSNILVKNIDDGHPIIFHVNTKTLNAKYSFDTGHYVVGHGYYWDYSNGSGYSSVSYYDPWYGSDITGTRTISIDIMAAAINNQAGFFIW